MKKQISEKMNSIQEVFNSMEKFNINHTVYTNNAFDTEILLSMVRMIDKIDSTLIDNNIEFLIDETIHYSNAINSNNYFIIKGLTKFKSDVLFLTKKIYNEYVKNTSIILKDGKNYLSSWTNTVNLSYEDIHISIQPLIFIDIDDHNKDVVGYDYLRAYCIDLALKWLLTADIINIAYDIFIKLTSYPVSAIILI